MNPLAPQSSVLRESSEHSSIGKCESSWGDRRRFSVVIPTHNRAALLARAIDSVYATGERNVDIVVVDDASSDETRQMLRERYPNVKCLQLSRNSGPGVARNLGIQSATTPWVLLLDDDDLLDQRAFSIVNSGLDTLSELHRYPVVQFARSNGRIGRCFSIIRLEDYFRGEIAGDFTSIIQVERFLESNLQFPSSRVGAEHLLWFHIAREFGIPTWRSCIAQLTDDAPVRLCSTASQLVRAAEYADMIDETLRRYGVEMKSVAPTYYSKKMVGAFTYRLLAGDRRQALIGLNRNSSHGRVFRWALTVMSAIPSSLLRSAFITYRKNT
ncbi:glycosyltransferase family 2 protein [uncultured Paludibaculum sp.]|uniref:glycosyltransferase family 2 protein n=1 Tax=uncultured Paludibaculum sp. TaxID=1765020 RepID=UPI002AAAA7CE|nr:glycosyltransferase family 2 protein [uncultured Paludibaculum sp.]